MAKELEQLPDDATHEQIQEFVDNLVVKEGEGNAAREAAKKKETEGQDAKAALPEDKAEDKPVVPEPKKRRSKSKNAKPNKERKADDDDDSAGKKAAAKKGDEDPDADEDGQDWLDDDLREEVSAYGIHDDDLDGFQTREELDRALRFLDRAALDAGRKQGDRKEGEGKEKEKAKGEQRSSADERGSEGRVKKPKSLRRDDGEDDGDGYRVSLDPNEYDEGVVREFTAMRDHYESRMRGMEERFASLQKDSEERNAIAEIERFNAVVDQLGYPELFGESGKETEDHEDNRKTLFGDYKAYAAGMNSYGRQCKLDKSFVNRVCSMTFAEHISKQQRKQLTRKLTRQSNMRMGGSAVKPTDSRFQGPPERDPELLALYERLEQESE